MRALLLALLVLLLPSLALAQETICKEGAICVDKEDMVLFIDLLKDKRCQQSTQPTFQLDNITIITDVDGRTYYSGAKPSPYTLKMSWCNYEVTAQGKVDLVVARRIPPTWGFRFRPKFSTSFLILDAFEQSSASKAIDVGMLWDFLYWRSLNVNVATGFRSVGAGVGFDITNNFGGYAGYAFSWWTLMSNAQVGLYFAF